MISISLSERVNIAGQGVNALSTQLLAFSALREVRRGFRVVRLLAPFVPDMRHTRLAIGL